jgi:hypothetical protein
MSLVGDCGAGFSSTFARLGPACSCDMVAALGVTVGRPGTGVDPERVGDGQVSSAKAENPSDQENDKTPGVAPGAPNQ